MIRTRPLYLAFLTAGFAVLLIAVNLVWLLPAIQSVRTSASVLAQEIAARIQGDIHFSLETTLLQMERSAGETAADPGRQKQALEQLLRYAPALKTVSVIGRDGRETFRLDRLQFVAPGDLRDYRGAREVETALGGTSNFGDILVPESGEPFLSIAVPIMRPDASPEVLRAEFGIRKLIRALETPSLPDAVAYVVDRDGFIIMHPDITELLLRRYVGRRPIVQKIVSLGAPANGLAPDDAYINEKDARMFAVGIPVSIAGLGIVLEQPYAKALAGERQMVLFAGMAVLLGLLIFAVIMFTNIRLTRLNAMLEERNQESVVSAKILVRRDREMVETNARLRELLTELESVGKMLVRRDLELSRANTRLEELDQIKSEFVSIAAHQLRTPLTGIRWSYQTILDRDGAMLTTEQRRLLESGLGASLRMIDLVNDLLSVARIEEGRFGIRLRKQPITPLIEQILARYAMLGKEKGVIFSLKIPQDMSLPDLVFDEDRISLVLDNLLDNALKYTEPGGTVQLRAEQEADHVRIAVQDTGVGIPVSQLHRVFTKFFRADNAIRLHTSGTGLGLYVAKNIIERHDGTIEVKSGEGKGSTFSFTLPIV